MIYRLKVEKDGGEVVSIALKKKNRLRSIYKHEKILKWDLEVVYQRDVSNAGTFKTRESMIQSLGVWTEPSLVKYATGGVW